MGVEYWVSPDVTNAALNALFADAWGSAHEQRDFTPVLRQGLGFICAYEADELAGFVNIAWDGGLHAFLLDTTVRTDHRLRGIGRQLVGRARELAANAGAEWLHVDFEPALWPFYEQCGFTKTDAALIHLRCV